MLLWSSKVEPCADVPIPYLSDPPPMHKPSKRLLFQTSALEFTNMLLRTASRPCAELDHEANVSPRGREAGEALLYDVRALDFRRSTERVSQGSGLKMFWIVKLQSFGCRS